MKMTNEMTDEAILAELGERLAKVRLDRNLMQAGFCPRLPGPRPCGAFRGVYS
jgi:hypothetical protein